MSNEIGVSAVGGAGDVKPVVKNEHQLKAEAAAQKHLANRIAELEADIASEQGALTLLDARKKTVSDRIAKLQAQSKALKGE